MHRPGTLLIGLKSDYAASLVTRHFSKGLNLSSYRYSCRDFTEPNYSYISEK